MEKDKIHKICQHIRVEEDYEKICKKFRISVSTINQLIGEIQRVLFWADGHCGSNVGLTPPSRQLKIIPDPDNEADRINNKWALAQKECWDWYINTLEILKPIDKCFILGDAIDGNGSRSGATELITSDRMKQATIATECIKKVGAKYYSMVFGTPYHCGKDEDFELDIAKNLNCKIGGHEWENVNGCIFDLKHKQSNCINPSTSLFNEIRDNREWAGVGEQPKADVLVRAHTHRFCITKMEDTIGLSLPALQAYGCLTAGHRILTSDLQHVPVQNLKVGDKLLAFEAEATQGKKRRWVESEVVANYPIQAKVYRIKLSDDTSLEATGEHPFLSQYQSNQYKWKTVEQLYAQFQKTSRPIKFQRTVPVWGKQVSYEIGYLVGFYDGEGCLHQGEIKSGVERFIVSACQNKLSAKQKENPCYRIVVDYIEKLGFQISNRKKSSQRENIHVFDVLGGLTEVLKFLGTVRPKRLLDKLDLSKLGQLRNTNKKDLHIISIVPIGRHEVWALGTTSETYISEGFLSHNTKFGARQCSRKVQFGLVAMDVWPDGKVVEHIHIARLKSHSTNIN